MAMAMMVSTRLWLGGVISPHRDKSLIQALAGQIRAMALCRPLLLAVDGLPSYVKAFQRAFRSKVPRFGQPGRCQGRAWSEIAIVQVVKARTAGQLSIQRRIVQGCGQMIGRLITTSQGRLILNGSMLPFGNGWPPWSGGPALWLVNLKPCKPGCMWLVVSITSVRIIRAYASRFTCLNADVVGYGGPQLSLLG